MNRPLVNLALGLALVLAGCITRQPIPDDAQSRDQLLVEIARRGAGGQPFTGEDHPSFNAGACMKTAGTIGAVCLLLPAFLVYACAASHRGMGAETAKIDLNWPWE